MVGVSKALRNGVARESHKAKLLMKKNKGDTL
jgi:hypothetical protein